MDRQGYVFIGVGFELLVVVYGSTYLGKKIDAYYGTDGTFTNWLFVLCIASWLFHFIFLLVRFQKNLEADEDSDDEGH